MTRLCTILLAAATALALAPATGALAADQTTTLTPGTSSTWEESSPAGTNLNYFGYLNDQYGTDLPTGQCSKTPDTYCDSVLVALDNPPSQAEIDGGVTQRTRAVTVSLGGFTGPGQTSDFDFAVYESDASGTRGRQLGSVTWESNPPTLTLPIVTTQAEPVRHILVEVVYWVGVGGYTGRVSF